MEGLTQERLKDLLYYNPEVGVFTWSCPTSRRVKIGGIAGEVNFFGYRVIQVDNRRYFAGRLAWFYNKGVWPLNEIDHKNGVRDDNRISNLREATHVENTRNKRISRVNRSGVKGVSWNQQRRRWVAFIGDGGKTYYLGTFESKEAAAMAYDEAATKIFGEFKRVAV